jgi:Ala-tRNA(Pro) deacylase
MNDKRRPVLEYLEKLDIAYTLHEHPPVNTVSEAEKYWGNIEGLHCKNLFLRDSKGNNHFLVVMASTKRADLKLLAEKIGSTKLGFASEKRLAAFLDLTPGSVTPFGLINDRDAAVKVVIDRDVVEADMVSFHPNENTATLTLSAVDFNTFLESLPNKKTILTFS